MNKIGIALSATSLLTLLQPQVTKRLLANEREAWREAEGERQRRTIKIRLDAIAKRRSNYKRRP